MRIQSKHTIRLYFLAAAAILVSGIASAQDKTPITEQVDVIRQYKPILGDAVKIKKSPAFFDENTQAAPLSYTYKNLKLLKDTARNAISADSLRKTDSLNTPFLYLKAGGGNLSTSLAELYLNSKPNPNGNYGAWFRHLSQTGKLANQYYEHDEVNLFGKKIFPHNFLEGALSGKNRNDYFYGYDHTATSYTKDQSKQSLQNIDARIEFGNNPDTTAPLYYGLKLHGNNFTDHFSNKENLVEASGMLGYAIGPFAFNLSSQLIYDKASLSGGDTYNTSLVRVEPYITLKSKLFLIKAGVNIVRQAGDQQKTLVFPDASLDLLLSYGFNLYGGIKGDVIQNSYSRMTEQNPWLKDESGLVIPSVAPGGGPVTNNLVIHNTRQNFDFFGGIKGAFSPVFNYRAQIETGVYDNLAFFINNPPDTRYFTLAYAGNGTVKEEFYAEVNYLAGSKFRMNLNLDVVDFKLKGIAEAWHTPKFKSGIWMQFNPSTHWMINASAYYTGEQKAEIYPASGTTGFKTLPSFTDISLGLEYRINKRISLFVNGNNLLNKQYQNYLNYPVLGLNAQGGITLSF